MSRCSLQLYVNENFTFSRPSLASSDDFLKNLSTSDWKRSSFATSHTDKEVLQKLNRLKTKNCLAKTLNDNYEEYHPILTSYLLRHTKSVEAYRRIRKQQEEILSLCRKKLAKKLSGSFLSGIRDEDIIRALKLIQDTELQLNEPHHSDTLIHSVLQGIISDDGKWSSKSDQNDNQTSTEDPLLRHLPQNFAYSSSALPKRRKRYNLVFKKLKGFFKKPRSIASTFTLTSKFTGQISTGNTFFRCPTKLFGPIEKELIYPYHIETSPQDYKIYASSAYEKAPRQLHIGMGSKSTCACHRNLLKLQNEFVKQQSEIRLINQNLEQCLCILHDIGDKPQTTHPSPYDSPAKNDIYVYSACPHSGPYGDRYYERSPDPNNYQILACRKASPKESRSSAKKDPKKKGGCCRKKPPQCAPNCPLQKQLTPVQDLLIKPVPVTKPRRKRKKMCGCCNKRKPATDTVSTTDSSYYGSPTKPEVLSVPGKSEQPTPLAHQGSRTRVACCGRRRKPVKGLRESIRQKRARGHIPKEGKKRCSQYCAGLHTIAGANAHTTTVGVQTDPFVLEQQVNQPTIVPKLLRSRQPSNYAIEPISFDPIKSMPSEQEIKTTTILPPPVVATDTSSPETIHKVAGAAESTSPKDATTSASPSAKRIPLRGLRSALSTKFRRRKKVLPHGAIEVPCTECTRHVKSSRCHCRRCRPKRHTDQSTSTTTSGLTRSRSRIGRSLTKSRSRISKSLSKIGRSRSRIGRSRSKISITPSKTKHKKSLAEMRKKCAEKKKSKKSVDGKNATQTSGKKKKRCSIVRFCKLLFCRAT